MKTKKCPLCNFVNTENALICKCGYDLSSIMATDDKDKNDITDLDDLFEEESVNSGSQNHPENNKIAALYSEETKSSPHKIIPSPSKTEIEKYQAENNRRSVTKKIFLKDPSSDFSIEITERTIIGRESNIDLISQNLKNKTAVSRKHAELSIEKNGVYIQDTNSKNGTFINEKKLSVGEKFKLKSSDRIYLGGAQSSFKAELMAQYIFEEK
ncbi:FHA domain-containing protein [Succinivibrio sp.]|uniref:FHA domain-containing protein n=1 Tax=Succinivibrio sp. TaxID=2053619 RepID=UPI0025D03BE6|nr:FHA domain-containing protein [Succinivibrio sp.]MBQ9220637.1 FHA domain-containing protein [Succinivibrio sp.]